MKSHMLLWKVLAHECASRCSTSATRDIKTVSGRFEHEGFSFLTITLANFGSDFEKSLDQGFVGSDQFAGFQRTGGLPKFLSGFLCRVFDRDGGVLLDDPCIDAILSVRQLTLLYKKILIPCSDARVKGAMDSFIECEKDVRVSDSNLSYPDRDDFKRIGALLFRKFFTDVDSDIYNGKVIPRHGPGGTADKLRGNAKYLQSEWTARMEEIFPFGENLFPSWSYYDHFERVNILEPGEERPVKVVPVPKTLKTPRIIAIEPTAMQYMQQGVLRLIKDRIKEHSSLDRMIPFNDQTPNQSKALEGSLTGAFATLDLSEASDRVSNQHVRDLVCHWPWLHKALDSTRSRKADVDGKTIRLAKFASMGSALCFPFEAFVFLTLVFLGIERELGTPLSQKDVNRLSDQVRIYGDDIIVPVDYVHSVVNVLSSYGMKVNTNKSFWTGKFRESCGKEYYNGFDVTYAKCRRVLPSRREHAQEIISMISMRNQFYERGYWETCKWLDTYIRNLIRHFPVVSPTSPVHGRHSFLGYETQRIDDRFHAPQVKGYVESAPLPRDYLDDYGAMLKCHLVMEKRRFLSPLDHSLGSPAGSEDHLERAGRPQSVYIKLRWASPF